MTPRSTIHDAVLAGFSEQLPDAAVDEIHRDALRAIDRAVLYDPLDDFYTPGLGA